MNDQNVMASVTGSPGLATSRLGLLSSSGLLIGAIGGYYLSLRHIAISRAMTFSAGILLAVVAVDLIVNARATVSLRWTVVGLLGGAGVQFRKRTAVPTRGTGSKTLGECVEQPVEEQRPGSGLAIAAGTFLDGAGGSSAGVECGPPGAPASGRSQRSSSETSRKRSRAAPECAGPEGPSPTYSACGLGSS